MTTGQSPMTKVTTFKSLEDFAHSSVGERLAREFANERVERVKPEAVKPRPSLASVAIAGATPQDRVAPVRPSPRRPRQ